MCVRLLLQQIQYCVREGFRAPSYSLFRFIVKYGRKRLELKRIMIYFHVNMMFRNVESN